MKKGTWIVIDGLDGCGKGTQMELLKEKMSDEDTVFTREPGGTPYAEKIRETILCVEAKNANPLTELFLFLASRSDHVEKLVFPALNQGKVVISDRADSSSWAFQIIGRENVSLKPYFLETRKWVYGDREPDMYIVLDLPPEVATLRTKKDTKRDQTHFDKRSLEFHQKVRDGFFEFAKMFPVRFVNAERSPEEVHADVWGILKEILIK